MSIQFQNLPNHVVVTVDTVSAGVILSSLAGILPPIAAGIAIMWYAIQIWESATVQKLVHPHHPHKRIKSHAHNHRVHPPEFGGAGTSEHVGAPNHDRDPSA